MEVSFRDVANNNTRTRDALHRESQPIAIVLHPKKSFVTKIGNNKKETKEFSKYIVSEETGNPTFIEFAIIVSCFGLSSHPRSIERIFVELK